MIEIIKISIILLVMILIISRKPNLSWALLVGIALAAIFFERNFLIFYDLIKTTINLETISLVIAFFFVFLLSDLLTETGILAKMLISLERIIRDIRLMIITIPSLIGLVPAPSGAMLSAPFVEEIGNKANVSSERKFIINYWFRHISEYLNPIYPGPIVAVTIVGITFGKLAYTNLPIMAFVFMIGFLLYVYKIKTKLKTNQKKSEINKKDMSNIFNGIWPIALSLLLAIGFNINIAVSLAASVILVIITNRVGYKKLKPLIKNSIKINTYLILFLILFFKTVLENSKAIEKVSADFLQLGIPVFLLIIVIPMLIGFLTGMTIGYVGVGFPLLLPFFNSEVNVSMPLVMLAYASGFFGVLISPTHLCLSMTKEYFKTDYRKVYRVLAPGLILVFVFSLILYFIGWPFHFY